MSDPGPQPAPPVPSAPPTGRPRALGVGDARGALEEIAPPTVLLDDRWNVLHVSPTASRFFQQSAGPLARRVTDLVRSELRHALHVLLLRASEQPSMQVSALLDVRFDDTLRGVMMLAQRRSRPTGPPHVLLTFLDMGDTTQATADADDRGGVNASLSTKLRDAEERLETMREASLLTTEELRAANEELQSLDEEYRSTTEELDTSKEELQSTNEELRTVNQELTLKLDELSRAHSDLENLMAATNVATLFLGTNLRIRWFTRQLADLFTIQARDLDRPIGDLRHTLNYDDFEADARRVLETSSPIERQTTSAAGRIYIARLSPYRTAREGAVDGVVVTFVDVTVLKQAEAALRESQQQLESEFAVIRQLHAMTLSVATAPELGDALQRLVAAAVALHGADQGHVQLTIERPGGCRSWRIAAAPRLSWPGSGRFRSMIRRRSPRSCARVRSRRFQTSSSTSRTRRCAGSPWKPDTAPCRPRRWSTATASCSACCPFIFAIGTSSRSGTCS